MSHLGRRNFVKTAAATSALSMLPFKTSSGNAGSENLIFLYIDDLNDSVGYMNAYTDVHTPNMDKLAGKGTAFLNAHSVVPQCNPSRVSTLFGVNPTKTSIYDNSIQYNEAPYLNGKKSLFRHLSDDGFRVYGGGKVFHSPWEAHNDVNWNEYYASPQRNHSNLSKDASGNELDISGVTNDLNSIYPHDFGAFGNTSDYSDYDVAEWASQKIKTEQDGFVMAVGFEKPHHPFVVPQKYFDLYDRNQLMDPSWRAGTDILDLPQSTQYLLNNDFFTSGVVPYLRSTNKMRDHVHAYYAAVSFVDEMVGKIVDAWETRKSNTTIILVSDHGQYLGEKLRIEKLYLWDKATRVPLIFAGPGIKENTQASPMSLLNLYPMACSLLGSTPPSHLDGANPLYALNSDISWTGAARSYFRYPKAPHKDYIVKSLRTDRFRISRWPDGYEFYDYNNDPKEMTNLWPECANWGIFNYHDNLL